MVLNAAKVAAMKAAGWGAKEVCERCGHEVLSAQAATKLPDRAINIARGRDDWRGLIEADFDFSQEEARAIREDLMDVDVEKDGDTYVLSCPACGNEIDRLQP